MEKIFDCKFAAVFLLNNLSRVLPFYINISNLENGRTQDTVGVGWVDGDVDGWYVARLEHPLVMAVLSVKQPEQTRGHHNNVNFTR